VSPEIIAATDAGSDILLLCDHASNAVPPGIAIHPELLERHIAIDIGAAAVTRALAAAIGAPAILASVSRLVIDLNRETDHPTLIPTTSDGHVIPGNEDADRFERIARFYAPYHRAVAAQVRAQRPRLILGIHSFTPRLESDNAPDRRWEIGILSNRDRRAADPAMAFLGGEPLISGDNEPYSGRVLNTTLNRHGEGQGIASIGIEIRNDLIRDRAGIDRWAEIITRMIAFVRNDLARRGHPAT
jgi:predicted N-formylglutamate amidohydrolase